MIRANDDLTSRLEEEQIEQSRKSLNKEESKKLMKIKDV
jgi:hypothetical protein